MLPRIDIREATSRQWDVVIAGSSFAAMFFLKGLPPGLSVLVVEKGSLIPHADQLATRTIEPKEDFTQRNSSGTEKAWIAHTLVGGNSNCWWACTPRFHPSDFRMKSLYGIAEDWPLTYDDLAPYYAQVEEIMEIAGGGSDHILPREAPFPYPPHTPSRTDRVLRKISPDWFAQPTARANGGSRATCCANGVCDLCPIDSKFTILNGIAHFTRPNTALITETEARAVRIEAGRATALVVRSNGRDIEIKASTVALATNAIFNAAILLRSTLSLPALGRGLNEQVSLVTAVDAPDLGPFGSTSITGHGYPLYDGPHRADHSGILIEIFNSPPFIRPEQGRWFDRALVKLFAEDLPQDDNRVSIEQDEPVLNWIGHHRYAIEGLKWGLSRLPELFEVTEAVHSGDFSVTEAHLIGTHRMGTDPAKSVTDDRLRCHGTPNLFALGSGAFTTSSMANPTLTLSALSLRAAEAVA